MAEKKPKIPNMQRCVCLVTIYHLLQQWHLPLTLAAKHAYAATPFSRFLFVFILPEGQFDFDFQLAATETLTQQIKVQVQYV